MATKRKRAQEGPIAPDTTAKHNKDDFKASNESKIRKTTRICIKQLPPSMTDATKVKNHLFQSQQSYFSHIPLIITDCKVLSKRRMAFVGCSTMEATEACVEYLHKSYCGSTRLVVEFALPPKEVTPTTSTHKKNQNDQPLSPTATTAAESSQKDPVSKKAKEETMDAKKQEFLAVMGALPQAKTQSRVWSNDDGLTDQSKQGNVQDPHKHGDSSDEDDSSASDSDDSDDADPLKPTTTDVSITTPSKSKQSDLDFFRSKMVSVQDLDEAQVEKKGDQSQDSDGHDDESSDGEEDEKDEAVPMKPKVVPITVIHSEANDPAKYRNSTELNEKDGDGEHHEEEASRASHNRLFVRNLAFDTEEDDLKSHFSTFGSVEECHIPVDDQHRGKGFGFVTFENAQDAATARETLDGTDFQGRLIHILAARRAPTNNDNAFDNSGMSYKEQQEMNRRGNSMKDQSGWSASHVRGDAVIDSLATRLGLRKGDILSVKDGMSGGDAAVRLALAETAIIEENRKYFADHGIDMVALVSFSTEGSEEKQARSKTSILVKNLPHDTTKDDLLKTFSSHGSVPSRVLLPPSRTVAVVEYSHPHDAKKGFKKLAYRRFRNVPLYLEWAPTTAFNESSQYNDNDKEGRDKSANEIDNDMDESAVDGAEGPSLTVYVKNLNFKTTEEELQSFFESSVQNIRTVRIPKKVAPVKRKVTGSDGGVQEKQVLLSMGYAFVEFASQDSARQAVKKLHGKNLAGHSLELQIARGGAREVPSSTKTLSRPPSKLIVRNVPFQATRKELLQLFGSFGQLKKARLPKKFDGNHRGFAFIEFVSGKEAAAAMSALSRTHLYGRHLVLEWAETETESVQGLREKAQQDEQMQQLQRQNKRKTTFE